MPTGFDIDNVLAESEARALALAGAEFDRALQIASVWSLDYRHEGRDVDKYIRRLFMSEEFFSSLQPLPGAYECVWHIAESDDIYYITGRSGSMKACTEAWLARFGFPEADVICTVSKPAAIERLDLEAYVEDDPAWALDVATMGVQVYLFSYPWNRGVMHPSIQDCPRHWEDIKDILEIC